MAMILYEGKLLIIHPNIKRTHPDAGPEFEHPANGAGYQISIERYPTLLTEMSHSLYDGCAVTALRPIDDVCAAEPGIPNQLDIPHFYSKNIGR